MQHWSANLRAEAQAVIGEGSLWDKAEQRLWWVDIKGRALFRFDPMRAFNERFDLPQDVGTVVVCSDGSLLVAQADGLSHFEPSTQELRRIINLEAQLTGNRLNDGKCDPMGRLWVGSMVEQGPPGGASLYCVDSSFRVKTLISNVTISNGLAWSADSKTFYYVDTPSQKVFAYDCDLERVALSNRRTIFEFPLDCGSPDGMTIDLEGNLWVAMFGGGRVLRVDPSSRKLTGEVTVAAKNVTSCAFGGPEQTTLFITTARINVSDAEIQSLPLSGSLFSVELPVQGAEFHRFHLENSSPRL